jgi:hypothetical protein
MATGLVDRTTVDFGQGVVGERLLHVEVFVTDSALVFVNRHDTKLRLLEARQGLAVNSQQRPDLGPTASSG